MKRISSMLAWVAYILLGAVFIYAGAVKIIAPAEFARSIYNYQILPSSAVNAVAIYLPWLEVLAGIGIMLIPMLRRASSLLILLMLITFTAAIAYAIQRGLNISCGCFSTDPEASKIGIQKIIENSGMILLAIWALLRSGNQSRAR